MKTIHAFYGLVWAVFTIIPTIALSQNTPQSLEKQVVQDLSLTPKMALGLTQERHIKGALNFIRQMEQSGVIVDKFEIVIWGKVVEQLKGSTALATAIEDNLHPKLQISVCEVAMERLGVTKEELPKGTSTVSNAFLRLLQLQAIGYNVIVP